ncbi:MAG: M15 family metallopeptidase [archaeon]
MKIKLVNLKKYGFILDNRKRRNYTKAKNMFARESVAKALVKSKESLPKKYNFKILDAKRSIADQKRIIDICAKDFKNRDAENWKKMLIKFTGGYQVLKQKTPMNTHRHGGAVDLTIIDEKGKELDMGGEKFDERDSLNYYENKKSLTKREKKIRDNRRLLKKVMKKAGFKPYFPEWTHWGYLK